MTQRPSPWPGVGHWYHARRLASTQDAGRRLAERGSPSGTLVTSETQSRGRGQRERSWSSGRGGLYLTLLTRPKVSPRRLASASLKAARAVAKTVAETGLKTRVKKPNDVFASCDGKEFRKVAGILLEASTRGAKTEWLLIGIGLNANNRLPKNLDSAASLSGLLGRPLDSGPLLGRLMIHLRRELPWAWT